MLKDYKKIQAEYRAKVKSQGRVLVYRTGNTVNFGIRKFKKAYPRDSKAIAQYKINAWQPPKEAKK